MSWNDYITLDGKKYKASDRGEGSYQETSDRPKTYDTGLTGKTIIQDFTVSEREPHSFKLALRVFIDEPWPDTEWGNQDDLLDAYRKPSVEMTHFNDELTFDVGIVNPITPIPRTNANISGECYGISYIDVELMEVFS